MGKFYVTTPIYYVNDVPHIGHAYTTIAADVLARYHRLMGDDVFFLTGTDEHGQNIERIAEEKGLSPQEYCDSIVAQFKELWRMLDISNDYFIRTTDARHIAAVQKFARALLASEDVYRGRYAGWYCSRCEAFYQQDELLPGNLCSVHQRPCEWTEEENYFFALSRYQDRLYHLIAETDFVQPEARRNELLGVLRQGLQDFSISRERVRWGIPLPDDPRQVLYVWVDALLNYITAIGYGDDPETFQRYWPADVHLMAKEIIRFHCLYWPAMLMAVGLPVPRLVFAHGWLTKDGQKLSKSTGNIIDPFDLVRRFGSDAVRYFFMREGAFGADWDYTDAAFVRRYNADLANDFGNLLNRTVQMVVRYFDGVVPEAKGKPEAVDQKFLAMAAQLGEHVADAVRRVALQEVLILIWKVVEAANGYVQDTTPWELAKAQKNGSVQAGERLATVLYNLVDVLRLLGYMVEPVMPRKARELLKQLGLEFDPSAGWQALTTVGTYPAGTALSPGEVLFPRYEQ
ncbi:MAG: methionine--tRNA ligase [Chloroflexi bacterium]|nr:methionine--tRNA ligase [Chloroflexota bacterium]